MKVLLALLLSCPALAGALAAPSATHEFSAEVDRRELYANEHVLLTLSLSGSDTRLRAEGVSPNVDLTVLAGAFELGVPRADFRFNVERNRGRASSSIAVELFPRRAGRLRIPAFSVDGLGTKPIELRVLPLPAHASPEVFTRSGLARKRLHAGEQTLLWLDLYHRVDLASASMGGALESRPRDIEAHALPASERVERIDGIDYQVTRTAWAVSSTNAGELALLLPDVWVETRQGKRWRLPFGEEHAEVSALPAGIAPGTPVGRTDIEITPPPAATAGEAAPFEVLLRSGAALNTLPAQAPLEPAPPGMRVYMDEPERRLEQDTDSVRSVVVYRGYLLAETPGMHETPAIRLPWFDAASDAAAVLRVPGKPFEVSAAAAQAMPVSMASAPVSAGAGDQGMAGDAGLASKSEAASDAGTISGASAWPWATLAFALLWLLTLAPWLVRVMRRPRMQPKEQRGEEPRQRLLTALGARTLEQGMKNWEAHYGSDEAVRAAIRLVQRLSYHAPRGEAALTAAIARALACIGERHVQPPVPPAATDPWSPRSFKNQTGSDPT